MTAGGPFELTLICDWGTKTIKDVYVGEVYLLSGQSNMEWKVGWSEGVLDDLYSDETACRNEQYKAFISRDQIPRRTDEKSRSSARMERRERLVDKGILRRRIYFRQKTAKFARLPRRACLQRNRRHDC